MDIVNIKIIDSGRDKYILETSEYILGRRYDNKAVSIAVERPVAESDSVCEMFVKAEGQLVDVIQVGNKAIDVTTNLSQYTSIEVGFSFSREDGYVKNSETKIFCFLDAIKPEDFTPEEPQGREKLNFLLSKAFVDAVWKDGGRNTLQFINVNDEIAKEINLNAMANISDAENKSLNANDISSNRLIYGGYIENGVLIDNIEPKVITSLDEYIDNGYYVLPSKYVDNKVDKFYLYKVEGLLVPIKASLFITVADRYTTLISDNYIYDSQNMTVFGRNNTNLGDNSILGGDNNISASKNGITVGRNNYSNAESCLVTGTDNIAEADCSTVVGTFNKSYANQGFVAGYNNKLLKGAFFASSMGTGNINQGTGTNTRGGYNLAGSEYSSAEGLDNIAGGNVTYDGVELADINRYSAGTVYSVGTLVKRNGFVYKALTENAGVEPNLDKTLDNWEIIEPIVTEQYARASKASGEKCIAKNTGAFVHGYRLKSARDYQTVVGKYNADKTNAMFVVGTGAKGAPKNAFEVNDDSSVDINGKTTIKSTIDVAGQANIGGAVKISGSTTLNSTAVINGETTLKSKLHIANGNSSATLRHNTSGEFVIGGDGGIRLRPNGDTATSGGLAIKDGYIAPERSDYSDLGSSNSQFLNIHLGGDIYFSGTSIRNILVPNTRKINNKTLSANITLTASDVGAYSKSEIDSMVGDINTALESILGV